MHSLAFWGGLHTQAASSSVHDPHKAAIVKHMLQVLEFTHFACTSEDINNLAHGLALNEARAAHLLPAMDGVIACKHSNSRVSSQCLLSREHPPFVTSSGADSA